MRYVMTLGQFLFLKTEAEKNDSVTAVVETDATDGTIDTHDVMIAYHYDGVALQFNVSKKHTLAAKVASDSYIERHIDEIIAEVLATANHVNNQTAVVLPDPLAKSSGIDGPTGDWTNTPQDSTGFPIPEVTPVTPVEGAS